MPVVMGVLCSASVVLRFAACEPFYKNLMYIVFTVSVPGSVADTHR